MPLIKRRVLVVFLGLLLLSSEVTLAAGKRSLPKVRQPQRVSSVKSLVKQHQQLQAQFVFAHKGAESLDTLSFKILEQSSLSRFERWRKNVDIDVLHRQYTQELISHLNAMASLFRLRREAHGFAKLREFDFQNMIRKSDYLLALPATRQSLEVGLEDVKSSTALQQTLAFYNRERQKFDRQVFTLAVK